MDNHTPRRLFVALSLPRAVVDFLEQMQKSLKNRGFKASWSRMEAMHLTLKFIGETPTENLESIIRAVQTTAAAHHRFKLKVQGVGVFPSTRKARVLWAGAGWENRDLSEIYQVLESNLGQAGIPLSKKRFFPHFTLARFRKAVDHQQIADVMDAFGNHSSASFECRSIDLVQSVLKSSGAVHTLVARADFKP
ncbi:RNA 2',3'-cyclic phosphodiesterase [Desulforapulum autotrophicum]|uniref:RNA 2',3'-cyclic phosphodiesterase n=1 Tax=Desulforapulum autotrophicum TaxID=2296 RepID=UPI00059CA8A1|nr:RNA 2',3'-cyclic phosphodiesterase [Desulforapulum autotrophicum]